MMDDTGQQAAKFLLYMVLVSATTGKLNYRALQRSVSVVRGKGHVVGGRVLVVGCRHINIMKTVGKFICYFYEAFTGMEYVISWQPSW